MKTLYGKKEKGVSPVIATILMVAITVVLASAVYLMVSGYLTGTPKGPVPMSFTYTVNPNNDVITVANGNISITTATPMTITITYNGHTYSVVNTSLKPGENYLIKNSSTNSDLNVTLYAIYPNAFGAGDTITLFVGSSSNSVPVPSGTTIIITYNGNTILSHTF